MNNCILPSKQNNLLHKEHFIRVRRFLYDYSKQGYKKTHTQVYTYVSYDKIRRVQRKSKTDYRSVLHNKKQTSRNRLSPSKGGGE